MEPDGEAARVAAAPAEASRPGAPLPSECAAPASRCARLAAPEEACALATHATTTAHNNHTQHSSSSALRRDAAQPQSCPRLLAFRLLLPTVSNPLQTGTGDVTRILRESYVNLRKLAGNVARTSLRILRKSAQTGREPRANLAQICANRPGIWLADYA